MSKTRKILAAICGLVAIVVFVAVLYVRQDKNNPDEIVSAIIRTYEANPDCLIQALKQCNQYEVRLLTSTNSETVRVKSMNGVSCFGAMYKKDHLYSIVTDDPIILEFVANAADVSTNNLLNCCDIAKNGHITGYVKISNFLYRYQLATGNDRITSLFIIQADKNTYLLEKLNKVIN